VQVIKEKKEDTKTEVSALESKSEESKIEVKVEEKKDKAQI
jgi:hypothetical protein